MPSVYKLISYTSLTKRDKKTNEGENHFQGDSFYLYWVANFVMLEALFSDFVN